MGQKVNPIGLRLGINRTWDSRWFARKEYGNLLLDDLGLRKFLHRRLTQAGLSRVVIERADVDFGYGTAKTTYGVCGVKVWVFKGEILAHDPMAQDKRLNEGQPASHERGRREALG